MDLLSADKPFPILAWIGPGVGNGAHRVPLNEKTMADLAEAGFNLSLSSVDEETPEKALDIARDVGVRLVVSIPGLRVGQGTVNDAWKERMARFVAKVRDHEGLYGYYLADEPRFPLFEDNAKAFAFIKEHDPEHLPYYNHWMVNMSFGGLHSYEEMWETYHEICRPAYVSCDCYPINPCGEDEWLANKDSSPYYFPRHKAKHVPHYYETLEISRQFSRIFKVPMWGFTRSRPGYSMATAEGEMRYQLMTAIAYGAKGVQYFSYAHGNMLVGADGEPTELWQIARKLNRELRHWEATIKKLRSIGVYHHPATHYYTRPLDQFYLGNQDDLCVRAGDDVVVGQFLDDEGAEYALICNRTPFEPSVVTFHFGTDGETEELSAETGEWQSFYRCKPRAFNISLAPGQGRLYRFKRDITTTNG